jgi:hypothetical protein
MESPDISRKLLADGYVTTQTATEQLGMHRSSVRRLCYAYRKRMEDGKPYKDKIKELECTWVGSGSHTVYFVAAKAIQTYLANWGGSSQRGYPRGERRLKQRGPRKQQSVHLTSSEASDGADTTS